MRKKLDQGTKDKLSNALREQKEIQKFEFYRNLVKNHLNSLTFSKKRISDIRTEIERACVMFPTYGPSDFKFLIDISELVYAARRAVAYSYVERYYLRGPAR
jgi:hypothetical protein